MRSDTRAAKKWAVSTATQILLAVVAFTMILPFLWMISSSLKANNEVTRLPFEILPRVIRWENYQVIFQRAPLLKFMLNSFKIALLSVGGLLVVDTCAAYAFSKLRFRGRDIVLLLFLATMMIPSSVLLIPKYIMFLQIGFIDRHASLILPALFNPFFMFMIVQYMKGIPDSLVEAAKIDGASHYATLARIIVPTAVPILATVSILAFIGSWNEFLNPLVFLKSISQYTIPVGIQSFNTTHLSLRAYSSAASLVALFPLFVVFLAGQRYVFDNLALSGMSH